MATATYERVKEQSRERVIEMSRTGRDIAPGYPKSGDLKTRNACERDFRLFCETYFPHAFRLRWSPDHLKAIARMEETVLDGGLFALAMPRASGKTTLCVRAALWALLYGHRRWVCLVAATEEKAGKLMEPFKVEIQYNERLARDFKQVCYPIQRLENNGRKAIGQLFDGEQTRIGWGEGALTFPTMPDSACDGKNVSGSTVSVAGITGALRGQSTTLATGEIIRPELVLLDDPQTRESSMSRLQCVTREAIITGDVLGMAGPDRNIAAIMPCTVIRQGDMADLMLDRKKNPEWHGQKTKMVYSFPSDMKLWEEYKRIRVEAMEADEKTTAATEFYRANREAMDAGAVVPWEDRFREDEVSAVQHAMNLMFLDERMFFCEYQNDPLPEIADEVADLTAEEIASKLSRTARGIVPLACTRLTAFIDVQGAALYWVVCAWEDNFSGSVVDYGTFPEQNLPYFALRDIKNTLADVIRGAGLEGQIYGGLELLTDKLLSRGWERGDGAQLKIERLLIDANWGDSTATVKKFCRETPFSSIVMPSHGKYVGAGSEPMGNYKKKTGERVGLNWRVPVANNRGETRHVIYDTNFWKSFVFLRLATAIGDRGCLTLFGSRSEAHRLFADHLKAEYRVRTQGRGREVDEWKARPERPDNHWFDGLAGAAMAASMQGVILPDSGGPAEPKRATRVSFAELQRLKKN